MGHDQVQKESSTLLDTDSDTDTGRIIRVDNILWKGLTLWKIPFHTVGNAHQRFFCIKQGVHQTTSTDTTKTTRHRQKLIKVQVFKMDTSAQMENIAFPMSLELIDSTKHHNNARKQIAIKDIMDVKEGQTTNAFQAFKARHGIAALPLKNLCFSIICKNERTYDLYTDSPSLTTMVIEALRRLLNQFMLPSSSSSLSAAKSLQALTIANLRHNFDPNLNERYFFAAAKSGDAKSFLWYLEHGININIMENDDRKDTPLIAACRLGRTNIVKIALQFNAKNDPHPNFGQTALQVAVASGHVDCARLILETAAETGANHIICNHEDFNKEAPIHVASRCGNINMLELLIDNGANMSLVDGKGRTCLHCAAQSGNDECLHFLLFTGCSTMLENRDDQGYTPLHVAVKGNKLDCVRSLLENGAHAELLTIDGKRPVELAGRSEKMHQILRQFSSSSTLPPVDVVSFEKDDLSDDHNIFEGLSLFNISGGVQTVQRRSSHPNNIENYSDNHQLRTWSDMSQLVNGTSDFSSCPSAESRFNDDHAFYFNHEYWHICYNSGYNYFVREADQHSQWYDPRLYGIVYPENGVAWNEDEPSHAFDEFEVSQTLRSNPLTNYSSNHRDIIDIKSSECLDINSSTAGPCLNNGFTAPETYSLEYPMDEVQDESMKKNVAIMSSSIQRYSHGPVTANVSFEMDSDLQLGKSQIDLIKPDSNKTSNSVSDISKYKKMIAVGIPMESVIHKMKIDGVNEQEIKEFSMNQSTQKNAKSDMSTLPADLSITTHKVDNDALEKSLLNLKHQICPSPVCHDLDLSKYEKMVSVGISIESVAHKMKVEGIDQDKIKAILLKIKKSDCDSTQNIESDSNQYNKSNQADPQVSIDDRKSQFENDETLVKYRKMVAVGVPHQSVANKMRQEGVDSNTIEGFEIAFGLKICKFTTMQEGERKEELNSSANINDCKSLFENDQSLAKYRKMAAVGVPHQSISNKMRQEGVDDKKIENFEIAYGLRTPSQISRAKESRPLHSLPIPPPVTRRTTVKMQKIHWKAVSEENVSNSLWADDTNYESDIDEKEVQQLESLFGAAKPKTNSIAIGRPNSKSSNTKNLSLVDMKRANNIAISLAQYKMFKTYDDLCSAVVSMDATKLTAEHLLNMKALLPTTDEMRKMASYRGGTEGLGRAELFFLSVSKFPRFAQKLDTFVFSLQFDLHVRELNESLDKLKDTCDNIVNNKKLAALLRKLLAIGNLVNEGAGKPRARGITVDSLLKTAKRTGSDGKTTVIYIVVANFLKQDETGTSVDFWSEIETLRDASRIDIKDCKSSFKEIEMGLKIANLSIDKEMLESDNSKFLQRSSKFVLEAKKTAKCLEEKIAEVEASVRTLCSFFAENPKSCQATSIFSLLLDFSKLVRTCKETYQRNARALKRKATMNTPIKVSRPSPSPMKRGSKTDRSIDKTLSFIVKAKSNVSTSKSNNDEIQWDDT